MAPTSDTPGAPASLRFAAGMLSTLDVMEKMADLIGVFNDKAPLRAHFSVTAASEAEVNAVAEMLGVAAKWAYDDYYRAELRDGNVTFTVGFLTPPSVPPADLGMLDALHDMAGASVPAGVAA